MHGDAASQQEQEDSDEFVEVDPTGRYGRYKEVLGRGAFKKVYRAFDELEGLEVAWNQVKVSELLRKAEDLERLYSEVHLLQTLKHKNIIKFYDSWIDTKNEHINFITEIFTSGTLHQYRKKHKRVDLRALKKWSKQILEGLLYLHSHDPPIIHRDLKCDNIFVNGNHGELKIGDLGLAAILHHANAAHSVIGTPEFMAPELYEEDYNELVDIYAFGMCLLELVTFEYPYFECSNAAQIYKKVTTGIKPASLAKVMDPDVKAFIEKCISNVEVRLSAKGLLSDPFLADVSPTTHSSHLNIHHSDSGSACSLDKLNIEGSSLLDNTNPEPSRDLSVYGERRDGKTIYIELRIADSSEKCRNIHFPFNIEADTSIAVASEMVNELDLADHDIPTIAGMIDSEIQALIPDWSPRDLFEDDSPFESHTSDCEDSSPHEVSVNKDDLSPMASVSPLSSNSLFPDQLPSSRKFWSDSPRTEERIPQNYNSAQNHGNSNEHEPKTNEVNHVYGDSNTNNLLEEIDKSCGRSVSDKNSKDVHDNGGLPPISTTIFNLGSDDGSMFQDEDLPVNPGNNNNLHEYKMNEVANEPAAAAEDKATTEKSGNIGSDLRIVADKLDQLIAQQQKQLDELQLEHKFEICNVLKDLPPQMHQKVLNMCRGKTPDYKLLRKMTCHAPNVTETNGPGNCSGMPIKRIFTRSLSTVDLSLSKSNSLRRESTSEKGIAVILKEESEEP